MLGIWSFSGVWSLNFEVSIDMTQKPITCPVYIAGEWRTLSDVATSPVYNPSTGDVIAETPLGTAQHVDEAVQAASAAFPAWRETPAVERVRVLFRYRQLIEENFDKLCRTVSREHR